MARDLPRIIGFLAAVGLAISAGMASGQSTKPAKDAGAKIDALPQGWEEIDKRMVFLAIRLASVETSIDAVNKVMVRAGAKQAVRKGDAEKYREGNELMDRKGGGPVRWQDF